MNKNISPKIRFKGHIDAWEQRKFSELAETRRGLTYNPSDIRDSGIRVLRSSNIAEDQFTYGEEDVFVVPDAVNIPYANKGDILITSANGSTRLVGKHAIIMDIPDNSAVHGGFMLLASAKNSEFVNALMSAPWYSKFISLYVAGGNGAIGNLNKNDLDEQDVFVPEDAEQKAIGQFFAQLDELITLHQRKHIKLQNAKKSMLWKMFPHNDNEIPEVRLKGFSGVWSLRKLNTFVNYSSSNLAAKDSMNKGRYDLYDANNIIGKTDHTPMTEDYITIIKDGAGVGRIRMLPKNSMFIGTMGALTARDSNLNFVFTLLTANNLGNSFSGSTIPHIYFKDYGENAYYIPHYNEQCAIGDFFKKLDDLIESENRYINKLLLMKQAFLNKMLVKVEA